MKGSTSVPLSGRWSQDQMHSATLVVFQQTSGAGPTGVQETAEQAGESVRGQNQQDPGMDARRVQKVTPRADFISPEGQGRSELSTALPPLEREQVEQTEGTFP